MSLFKKNVLYDMPTDFSDIENVNFIFTESVEKLNQMHFFVVFKFMIENYRYFSMDQLIYNVLYNNEIENSRCNILNRKLNIPYETMNCFLKGSRFLYRQRPVIQSHTKENFQYIYSSMSHWMHKNFYEFYKLLLQLKIRYSSCFFSEVCSFVKCSNIVNENIFFENWNEFLKFSNMCQLRLVNVMEFTNDFQKDFWSKDFSIDLNSFLIYYDDLYVKNSICSSENCVPYGSQYYIRTCDVMWQEQQQNSIRVYIRQKQYCSLYHQYMGEILEFKKPRFAYGALSRSVYMDILNQILFNEFNEDGRKILDKVEICEKNGVLMHGDSPIIFYYKAYQLTGYKMYFLQQDINKFFAYNLNTHMVELIKSKKSAIKDYEVTNVVY